MKKVHFYGTTLKEIEKERKDTNIFFVFLCKNINISVLSFVYYIAKG